MKFGKAENKVVYQMLSCKLNELEFLGKKEPWYRLFN